MIAITFKRLQKQITSRHKIHKHSHTPIHLHLVVAQHFKELFVALLRDEDALSGRDAAAAGQTVIQRDLCFLQLLLPTILQSELIQGKL